MAPVTYTNKTWTPCSNVLFRYADGVEATLRAKFNIDLICIQILHPRILISSGADRNALSALLPLEPVERRCFLLGRINKLLS